MPVLEMGAPGRILADTAPGQSEGDCPSAPTAHAEAFPRACHIRLFFIATSPFSSSHRCATHRLRPSGNPKRAERCRSRNRSNNPCCRRRPRHGDPPKGKRRLCRFAHRPTHESSIPARNSSHRAIRENACNPCSPLCLPLFAAPTVHRRRALGSSSTHPPHAQRQSAICRMDSARRPSDTIMRGIALPMLHNIRRIPTTHPATNEKSAAGHTGRALPCDARLPSAPSSSGTGRTRARASPPPGG